MAAVVSRRVRTTQPAPAQALQIDWSNPITRDMTFVACLSDAGYGNLSTNGQATFSFTSGSQANTPQGTGARTSANPFFAIGTAGVLNSTNYSMFAAGSCTSGSSTQSALDMDNGTTRYFQFRIANGKADFIPFNTSAAVTGQATSPTALSVAEMSRGFTMGATASPTRTAVFQNGVVTVGSAPSNLTAPGTNMPINIGARQTNTQAWSTGGLSLVATWLRTLTDAEMQSLADNPWQLFKPAPRRLWLAYSASAPTGAALSGSAAAIAQAYGDIITAIPLAASAAAAASATASLTTQITLNASATAQAFAQASLSTQIRFAGSAAGVASTSGALSTQISLSGSAQATASASATLSTSSGITGTATAQAIATGTLTTAIPLSGSSTALATTSATLTTGSGLAGSATGQATASASLTTSIALAGAAIAQAQASASLAGQAAALSGSAAGRATASAQLTTGISLTGAAQATASGQAALSTQIALVAIAQAQASSSGSLQTAPYAPPATRVFGVAPESRVYYVAPESRVFSINPEIRTSTT